MAFYAANFIYDGIISSDFGIRITSDSDYETNPGANVQLLTQELYRRPKVFLLGVQQSPVLEIPIKINVPDQLSATEDAVISNWLFGRLNYKKLQIIQSDMQYVYYNCIFTNKQTIRVGNIIRGYTGTIICDSPFAWTFPQTKTYTYTAGGYSVDDVITVINTSDSDDYTYPTVAFKVNSFGGSLSIINNSDVSGSTVRQFYFTSLPAGQTITVNNDLQIISASPSGGNYLPNFVHYTSGSLIDSETSYNWLRYVKGKNVFSVTGNIDSISFTHQFAKKIS